MSVTTNNQVFNYEFVDAGDNFSDVIPMNNVFSFIAQPIFSFTGTNTLKITVQGSADGEDWSDLAENTFTSSDNYMYCGDACPVLFLRLIFNSSDAVTVTVKLNITKLA